MAATGSDDADVMSVSSWRAPAGTSDAPPSEADNGSSEDFLYHLYRGSELLKDDRVYEAKEALEAALGHKPKNEKGQDLLAAVYFRLGHYPRAVALYDQLLRKSPKQPALLMNLALCHLKTGQAATAKPLLEDLVASHPSHIRAWGYLGLAYERLDEFAAAEHAYRVAGHTARALRMGELVERRARAADEATRDSAGSGERTRSDSQSRASLASQEDDLRAVATAAFESIDTVDPPFSLAAPASDASSERDANWRPMELGHSAESARKPTARDAGTSRTPRRPTFPVAPPPSHVPAHIGSARSSEGTSISSVPAAGAFGDVASPASLSREAPPSKSLADAVRTSQVDFPPPGGVKLHASGLALVRTRESEGEGVQGFAVRMEALRATHAGLVVRLLSRRMRGKETSEPFGGITSPVVELVGKGEFVCGSRSGYSLAHFLLHDETCFLREDAVIGFDLALGFENGRLVATEGDVFPVVQLKGSGAVLMESRVAVLSLEVTEERSLHVRRETIIGWMGRIVPRALPPSEAPCGQRGLIAFSGDGSVLLGT